MIVVIAIDALEYNLVEKFNYKNLKQEKYGKTDISEFSQPRTMVLWSSFMTGENKENEILALGDKKMWNYQIDIKDTFFSKFKNPKVIDLPGFSYDLDEHKKERELLKAFFEAKTQEEKEKIKKEYNQRSLEHHKKIKNEFEKAIKGEHDFVLGYFSAIDVIGHLNFGNKILMKMLYKDMDELAKKVRTLGYPVLILSDHGMKAIGNFGDHSEYGFWSVNFETNLKNPKITDFKNLILDVMKEKDKEFK